MTTTIATPTMTVAPTDRNPLMDETGAPMDHWRCTLRYQGRRMTVTFSKGIGHHGAEPTAVEVLECLAMDAAGFENAGTFEAWCNEYGYSQDSRRAERTYKAVERQAKQLERLMGEDYESILYPD